VNYLCIREQYIVCYGPFCTVWCRLEMCATCYAEQLQAEYLAQMSYENATIYVTKVDEVDHTIAHTNGSAVAPLTAPSASSTAFDSTEDYVSVTDEQVLFLHLITCVKVICE